MHEFTYAEMYQRAKEVTDKIHALSYPTVKYPYRIYGVPRGGVYAALLLRGHMQHYDCTILEEPENGCIIIDDLIDSGATREQYSKSHPESPFFALIDKQTEELKEWVLLPWEKANEAGGPEDNVRRLIQFVGDDPKRGGLEETPKRVVKAWREWCSGYQQDPAMVLKCFEDGADGCDELVLVKDIPFYSHCEHHMAPFFGTATVGYIPRGKIVGLSKLSRLVSIFSRRLQVQERLTNQIANALSDELNPVGVGVVIRARHLCMESRGVCQQGHHTVTSALRGVIKDLPEARAEFMQLIQR